jgi:WD40 repeat protein
LRAPADLVVPPSGSVDEDFDIGSVGVHHADRLVVLGSACFASAPVGLTIATAAGLAVASATGSLIAIAAGGLSPAQQVGIYDATDGRLVRTLEGHTGTIHDLAISDDGTRLASASADGTTRLWDIGTGEELLVLRDGVGALISSVSFSPDGSQLALIAIAERTLTRGFTDDECSCQAPVPV